METRRTNLTCNLVCWLVAALSGALTAWLLINAASANHVIAVIAGVFLFLILGGILAWLLCGRFAVDPEETAEQTQAADARIAPVSDPDVTETEAPDVDEAGDEPEGETEPAAEKDTDQLTEARADDPAEDTAEDMAPAAEAEQEDTGSAVAPQRDGADEQEKTEREAASLAAREADAAAEAARADAAAARERLKAGKMPARFGAAAAASGVGAVAASQGETNRSAEAASETDEKPDAQSEVPVAKAQDDEAAPQTPSAQDAVAPTEFTAQMDAFAGDDFGAHEEDVADDSASRSIWSEDSIEVADAPIVLAKPAGLSAPRAGKADDLTQIKGVDAPAQATLNAHGIYHYDQISDWSEGEIAWANDTLDGDAAANHRESWPAQATILAGGGSLCEEAWERGEVAEETTPDFDKDGIKEGRDDGIRPESLSEARGGQADDLKKIKGVGPKLESLLNALGFYHFDQIAAWTADEVAWVDANLQGFKGRVSRDKWVQQAGLLASGSDTEFSKRVEDGDVY